MNKLDNFSHRLSVKEEIAYEKARELIQSSLKRLKTKKYKSKDLYRSAYKYSRYKMEQKGGSKCNHNLSQKCSNCYNKYKINYHYLSRNP